MSTARLFRLGARLPRDFDASFTDAVLIRSHWMRQLRVNNHGDKAYCRARARDMRKSIVCMLRIGRAIV